MEEQDDDAVALFTDGSCLGNPGPGGWAALLRWKGNEREIAGSEPMTTNNRMELTAAIRGIEALKRASRVRVHTDSRYLRDGITKWIHRWKQNGWRTSDKKPVKNDDLWKQLDAAMTSHDVRWDWVRGHAGHPENERVDQLANAAARLQAEIRKE